MFISVVNLTKSFGKRKVLDQISFNIPEGKITGFLGPNGAGKTTAIKCLLGLIRKDEGKIIVNREEIHNPQDLKFKIRVGALVEFPSFFSHLTPEENLKVFSLLDGQKISSRRIKNILNLFGLGNYKNKKVKTFSLGMKQRLAIALAFLNNPELLILDEPFNGLDPISIEELKIILRDFKKRDRTVFISSHILEELEDLCDDIILINKGKIIAKGNLKNLLSNLSLKEFFFEQVKK